MSNIYIYYIYIYCIYSIYILHIIYICLYIYNTTHTLYITYSISILIIDTYAHKDYIHHDFYVYSPVLLTQYLGHCWHTPCTELYILRISAWLLRKPPLPCHRGGNHLAGGGGGCGGPCSYIYIYNKFTNHFIMWEWHTYHLFMGFKVNYCFTHMTQMAKKCCMMAHVCLFPYIYSIYITVIVV